MFLQNVLKISPKAFEFLSPTLRKDKDFCAEIIKAQNTNIELITQIVSLHGKLLQFACKKIRDSKHVVRIAVDSECCAFEFASEKMKKDRDILPHALHSCAMKGCYCIMIPVVKTCLSDNETVKHIKFS